MVNYSENVDKITSFLNVKLENRFQTNMDIRSLFASAKKWVLVKKIKRSEYLYLKGKNSFFLIFHLKLPNKNDIMK